MKSNTAIKPGRKKIAEIVRNIFDELTSDEVIAIEGHDIINIIRNGLSANGINEVAGIVDNGIVDKNSSNKAEKTSKEPKTRLIPASDWNDYHEWPPSGGLRHLIFYEKTNGFHKCIRRVGRRVLIDEDAFFRWVEETNRFTAASKTRGGSQ